MKIRGIDLEVKITGDKTPFIWAHGLLASMAVEDAMNWFEWDSVSRVAKLIRYDARGHGQSQASEAAEDYLWSNLAKDMIAIADELGVDKFITGGRSMGCATSIYAGLLAPERVTALVLVSPPTAWGTRAKQVSFYGTMEAVVQWLGVRTFAWLLKRRGERLLPAWLAEAEPARMSTANRAIKGTNRRTVATVLRGAKLCDLPPHDVLKSIVAPALILAWTGDCSHPLETAQTLNALMPKSKLVVAGGLDELKTWPRLMCEFIAMV